MPKKITTEEFVNISKNVHGNEYDYSLVNYEGMHKKITIICPIHGEFEQRANCHRYGRGCAKCGKNRASEKCKKNTEQFIKEAKKIHGNKYDYSLTDYVLAHDKVKIICPIHGIFTQKAYKHLSGHNCNKCAGKQKLTNRNFINKSKKIHGDIYDYSKVSYENGKTKVKIICKKHGEFKQSPEKHLMGQGCTKCQISHGERLVRDFLNDNNINHEIQKMFQGCRHKTSLKFDFYLPEYNLCIEYNGEQHYKPVKYFGGNNKFYLCKKRDEIKESYCKENNINLLVISYKDKINISKIIKNYLNNHI
jgi:hypothetical protein